MINADKLKELVAKFPVPAAKDGKLAEVDKTATDAALAELVAGGKDAVAGLVGMLVPADKGGDGQARHALHALAVHAATLKDDQRRVVSEALVAALDRERPAEVNRFVLRQIQVVGRKEVVPTLGKFATDEALGEDAVRVLVAIRTGAAEQLRAALPRAKGRNLLAIAQALGTLKDTESLPALRKLLGAEDSDLRQVAGWALAHLADAEAADELLTRADAATGFERTKLTDACLDLAENLLTAGKKKEAVAIYSHLQKTRTEEKHVREAAARGLVAAK
jgi:HEAT repeat protein